jgi:hypothetical protein
MRQRLTRQLLAFSTQCHEACAPQQPEETTAADAGTCFQAGQLATSLVTGQEGNAAAAQAGSSNRPAELTAVLPHLLGLRLGLRSSPSVHFQPMKSKSLRTAQSTCTTAPNIDQTFVTDGGWLRCTGTGGNNLTQFTKASNATNCHAASTCCA